MSSVNTNQDTLISTFGPESQILGASQSMEVPTRNDQPSDTAKMIIEYAKNFIPDPVVGKEAPEVEEYKEDEKVMSVQETTTKASIAAQILTLLEELRAKNRKN